MKLFTIEHIHRWENGHNGDRDLLVEIFKELKLINKQNQTIMAKFADIKTAFDEFKQVIVDERAQANAKLDEMQTSIDNLTANIQNGGTEEERATLLADINTQMAEVRSIIPDATAPLPETPTEEPPVGGTVNP
jgi:hypothetical protein